MRTENEEIRDHLKYLSLLARDYPSQAAAASEIGAPYDGGLACLEIPGVVWARAAGATAASARARKRAFIEGPRSDVAEK